MSNSLNEHIRDVMVSQLLADKPDTWEKMERSIDAAKDQLMRLQPAMAPDFKPTDEEIAFARQFLRAGIRCLRDGGIPFVSFDPVVIQEQREMAMKQAAQDGAAKWPVTDFKQHVTDLFHIGHVAADLGKAASNFLKTGQPIVRPQEDVNKFYQTTLKIASRTRPFLALKKLQAAEASMFDVGSWAIVRGIAVEALKGVLPAISPDQRTFTAAVITTALTALPEDRPQQPSRGRNAPSPAAPQF